jgi:hypothetical protein
VKRVEKREWSREWREDRVERGCREKSGEKSVQQPKTN